MAVENVVKGRDKIFVRKLEHLSHKFNKATEF